MERMWALITGASSGLGEIFAHRLARDGYNLVLTARSEDRLASLAEALTEAHGCETRIVIADLVDRNGAATILANLQREHVEVDLLINNAGFGVFEKFLDKPLQASLDQISVNVCAPVELTRVLTSKMVSKGRGGVINVASTAAFQPLAGANIYAATKAFLLSFSEALAYELKGTGVTVTAACPGPVATQFFAQMTPALKAEQMDQPGPVVDQILAGFRRGRRVVYPGRFAVRASTWGARFLPRDVILHFAARIVAKLNQR